MAQKIKSYIFGMIQSPERVRFIKNFAYLGFANVIAGVIPFIAHRMSLLNKALYSITTTRGEKFLTAFQTQ